MLLLLATTMQAGAAPTRAAPIRVTGKVTDAATPTGLPGVNHTALSMPLTNLWFADSFLAIDQGPMIVMIENQRSGLLWNLFMSCPEVKKGMKNLGSPKPKSLKHRDNRV